MQNNARYGYITLNDLIAELQNLQEKHGNEEILSIGAASGHIKGMSSPYSFRFASGTCEYIPSYHKNTHAQKDLPTANTKINYLYRDACNYKVYNECVVEGTITEEQQKMILECLDEGEYFIPSKVGLPEEKFGTEDDPDVDHEWFELGEGDFSRTFENPTVSITANELVQAFLRCKDKWVEAGITYQTLSPEQSGKALDETVFTIVNGIEVDLRDYIGDDALISKLMLDQSFQDAVSFAFEKEFAIADEDVSGEEVLETVIAEELARWEDTHKVFEQGGSQKSTYSVCITQKLEGFVDIEADSPEEALELADATYNAEGCELPDMEDGIPLEFEVVNCELLRSEEHQFDKRVSLSEKIHSASIRSSAQHNPPDVKEKGVFSPEL